MKPALYTQFMKTITQSLCTIVLSSFPYKFSLYRLRTDTSAGPQQRCCIVVFFKYFCFILFSFVFVLLCSILEGSYRLNQISSLFFT